MRKRAVGAAAGGAGRPRPVGVVLASVATVILVIMLVSQHPPGTARLSGKLSTATRSGERSARPRTGPAATGLPNTGPAGTARPFGGTPAIGALFTRARGRLGRHFCTASVVDSPRGNLVLTAAHCVSGTAPGQIAFGPGYHGGALPYGTWPVLRVVVDHAWASSADPDDDFAFLVMGRRDDRDLAGVTGAEGLGFAGPHGQMVQVAGYPSGSGDPIRCQTRVRWASPHQLRFDCRGYSGGTSGSPLLAGVSPATGLGAIIGVIGGYERGGDTSGVSYAARFGPSVAALYRAAVARS